MQREAIIKRAYELFNARKADDLLLLMTPDVHWPNGWEGGYVNGRSEVKAYWERQWGAVNPKVIPQSFENIADSRLRVSVKQTVKDLQGNLLFDGLVNHIYTFHNDLISEMQIEPIG